MNDKERDRLMGDTIIMFMCFLGLFIYLLGELDGMFQLHHVVDDFGDDTDDMDDTDDTDDTDDACIPLKYTCDVNYETP
jgi:hypothetical protein